MYGLLKHKDSAANRVEQGTENLGVGGSIYIGTVDIGLLLGSCRVLDVLDTLSEWYTYLLFIAIFSSVDIVLIEQAAKVLGRK